MIFLGVPLSQITRPKHRVGLSAISLALEQEDVAPIPNAAYLPELSA